MISVKEFINTVYSTVRNVNVHLISKSKSDEFNFKTALEKQTLVLGEKWFDIYD